MLWAVPVSSGAFSQGAETGREEAVWAQIPESSQILVDFLEQTFLPLPFTLRAISRPLNGRPFTLPRVSAESS